MSEKVIRTVLGDICPEELGFCDMHEHTVMDMGAFKRKFPLSIPGMLAGIKGYQGGADLGTEGERRKQLGIEPPAEQQDFSAVFSAFSLPKDCPARQYSDLDFYVHELKEYKKAGGSALLDCSPSMRGDNAKLVELAQRTGVHIVMTYGYYTDVFIPNHDFRKGVDYMTAKYIDAAKNGDGSCEALPGFFKCAVSRVMKDGSLSAKEKAAVEAAARASVAMGLPVHIHTQFPLRRAHIDEVVDLIENKVGLNPDKVLFCHMDGFSSSPAARINAYGFDQDYLMGLCEKGFHLGIDTWGTKRGLDEEPEYQIMLRLNILREMAAAGYADKLTVGCDVMNKLNATICGQYGYTFHPVYLKKMVEKGLLDPALYHKITVENPAAFMAIER